MTIEFVVEQYPFTLQTFIQRAEILYKYSFFKYKKESDWTKYCV